jgi:hypothetical protein
MSFLKVLLFIHRNAGGKRMHQHCALTGARVHEQDEVEPELSVTEPACWAAV